jgi:hypothetical protein
MALALPAAWEMILYCLCAIAGSFAIYYFGKWAAKWANEFKTTSNQTTSADGKSTADTSDQNLNDQTAELPKD